MYSVANLNIDEGVSLPDLYKRLDTKLNLNSSKKDSFTPDNYPLTNISYDSSSGLFQVAYRFDNDDLPMELTSLSPLTDYSLRLSTTHFSFDDVNLKYKKMNKPSFETLNALLYSFQQQGTFKHPSKQFSADDLYCGVVDLLVHHKEFLAHENQIIRF